MRLERGFVLLKDGQVWTAVPACGQIVVSLPSRPASKSNEIGRGGRRTAIDAGTAVKIDSSPARSQCRLQRGHALRQIFSQRYSIVITRCDSAEVYLCLPAGPQHSLHRNTVVRQVVVALQAHDGRYAKFP